MNDLSRKIAVEVIIMKKGNWVRKYRQFGTLGIFWSYSIFFGICNTDVGIGIWKYRSIGLVSVLPTHHFHLPFLSATLLSQSMCYLSRIILETANALYTVNQKMAPFLLLSVLDL